MTKQVEVADGIEDLIGDELVAVAQTILVENTELVENDGVFQPAAEGRDRFRAGIRLPA